MRNKVLLLVLLLGAQGVTEVGCGQGSKAKRRVRVESIATRRVTKNLVTGEPGERFSLPQQHSALNQNLQEHMTQRTVKELRREQPPSWASGGANKVEFPFNEMHKEVGGYRKSFHSQDQAPLGPYVVRYSGEVLWRPEPLKPFIPTDDVVAKLLSLYWMVNTIKVEQSGMSWLESQFKSASFDVKMEHDLLSDTKKHINLAKAKLAHGNITLFDPICPELLKPSSSSRKVANVAHSKGKKGKKPLDSGKKGTAKSKKAKEEELVLQGSAMTRAVSLDEIAEAMERASKKRGSTRTPNVTAE